MNFHFSVNYQNNLCHAHAGDVTVTGAQINERPDTCSRHSSGSDLWRHPGEGVTSSCLVVARTSAVRGDVTCSWWLTHTTVSAVTLCSETTTTTTNNDYDLFHFPLWSYQQLLMDTDSLHPSHCSVFSSWVCNPPLFTSFHTIMKASGALLWSFRVTTTHDTCIAYTLDY